METHTDTPRSHTLGAIAVTTVIIVGGLVAMRQELLTAIAQNAAQEQEASKKLAEKMALLDSRLTAVEAAPKPDGTVNEAIKTDLSMAQEAISQLQTKLAAVEEKQASPVVVAPVSPTAKPVDAAPATTTNETTALATAVMSGSSYQAALDIWEKAHPKTGGKLTALRQNGLAGVATESMLREQFRDILGKLSNTTAEEPESLQRVNTRLSGLISIKKATEKPKEYDILGNVDSSTTLDALTAKVDALPEDARAPFAAWRETVRTRADVLAELATLTAGDVKP
jgi:hypothetical protein